jgi:predicted N-formylglutamate amidohydrolase
MKTKSVFTWIKHETSSTRPTVFSKNCNQKRASARRCLPHDPDTAEDLLTGISGISINKVSLAEVNTTPPAELVTGQADYPLIGPEDPPPYSIYNAQGSAPILLVCDHASRQFPAAMHQLGLADWVLDQHVACDIGAGMVTRHLADRLNAPAVLAGYSRLIVDLNRQLHHESAFARISDGIAIPGNQDIGEQERVQRIQSFFNPYHDAITGQLNLFEKRSIVPAFLSIHSCTPVFNNVVRHCQIGVMWDQDPRIPVPLIAKLNEVPDLEVGDNEPYSGRHPDDYTIDFHAERTGLPSVGIEVRQDLVSTPQGVARWADVLGEAFESVLGDTSIFTIV